MAAVGLCESSASFVSLGEPRGTLGHPLARTENGKVNSRVPWSRDISIMIRTNNIYINKQYQLII